MLITLSLNSNTSCEKYKNRRIFGFEAKDLLCYYLINYIFCHKQMSNPFEYFANDEEDDTYQQVPAQQKPKRTHAEKRAYKQQQETVKKPSAPVVTQQLPQKHKQNAK